MLTTREIESLGTALGDLISDAVEPLYAKIAAIEKNNIDLQIVLEERIAEIEVIKGEKGDKGDPGESVRGDKGDPGERGEKGDAGKSVTIDEVRPLIEAEISKGILDLERRSHAVIDKAIDRIPIALEAKELEVSDALLESAVKSYLKVNPIPIPKDGKDGLDGRDGVNGKDGKDGLDGKDGKDGIDGKDGNDGLNGKDGKSVTVDDVMPKLTEILQKSIDAIPAPKDGKDGESVTLDDILPVIKSMTAEWQLDFEKRAQATLEKIYDRVPTPKDGKDGFSLKDFDFRSEDGGRTLIWEFDDGQTKKDFRIETYIPKYREVWEESDDYRIGDCVTYSGSMWIAVKPSKGSKPGQYNRDWKLAVKRGQSGKSK